MFKIINTFLIIIFSTCVFAEDACLDWFNEAKLKSSDKSCLSKCVIEEIDMSTFLCHNECEKLCRPKQTEKCETDQFWKNKIKSGRPKNWNNDFEQTTNWTKSESEKILEILNLLPDELKKIDFEGIYRMKKSSQIINPGSTASDGKTIVLFDRAFENPNWTAEEVLLHELGHVYYLLNLNAKEVLKFQNDLGWNYNKVTNEFSRQGSFVSSRAKESPEEDFAENFTFVLLNKKTLIKKDSIVGKWLLKKLGNDFKLKSGCVK